MPKWFFRLISITKHLDEGAMMIDEWKQQQKKVFWNF